MRFIDVCHAVALAVLLGWLFFGNLIGSQQPGGPREAEQMASNPPAVGASNGLPRSVATARVDERSFRIFVAESPDAWSVAVSEDD